MDGLKRSADDPGDLAVAVGWGLTLPGITVERLRPEHCRIVPYMREADVQELLAMCPISPTVSVAYSIATARPGYAVLLDGEPIAIFGCGQRGDGAGVPWLVGTDEMERHPVAFYRASRVFIREMSGMYDYLENYVDVRNTLSVRWLKWAGFVMEEPEVLGSGMFHRFWMGQR